MQKDYETLLKNLSRIDPPKRLYANILTRIKSEQMRKARIQFMFTGTTAVCSSIALIPALQYATQEFSQSGFLQYLSLLFSDGGTITLYWKEFALSLAESLPILGVITVLSVLSTLLGSLILAARSSRAVFMPA